MIIAEKLESSNGLEEGIWKVLAKKISHKSDYIYELFPEAVEAFSKTNPKNKHVDRKYPRYK